MHYIRNSVNKLIRKYGTRDPFELAELLSIQVIKYPFRKIRGLIFDFNGQKIIGLTSNLPEYEQKVIIAHELGHAHLSPTDGYYFMIQNTLFSYGKEEKKANKFAAELLIGDEKPELDEDIIQFADRLGVPLELVKVWK